jgi:hypothetical protein
MQLIDWMRLRGVDDETLAERVNRGLPPERHCSPRAVRKWKYGEREPRADKIARLEKVTRKLVTVHDWAQLRELREEKVRAA